MGCAVSVDVVRWAAAVDPLPTAKDLDCLPETRHSKPQNPFLLDLGIQYRVNLKWSVLV